MAGKSRAQEPKKSAAALTLDRFLTGLLLKIYFGPRHFKVIALDKAFAVGPS
jgi:hypothetical protein